MRQDGDITTDSTVRLTVSEAAGALGISAEAVRQRIKRGTLATEKDADGSVFVLLEAARIRHNADRMRPNNDRTSDITTDLALMQAHLDSMQTQIDYPKEVVARRDEEIRRRDHLLAAALERIPAIEEAPSEKRDAPETVSETEGGGEAPSEQEERRSWLYRLFFGP